MLGLFVRPDPVQVGSETSWTTVGWGYLHRCATRADGSLWCSGDNGAGQLGDGTLGDIAGPAFVEVAGPYGWTTVTGNSASTCGLATDGAVRCWGSRGSGTLGDDLCWAETPVPVALP